jgi:hypothetical protein
MTMSDNHIRTLLEDASAGVPEPNLTAAVVKGAHRRRVRRRAVGTLAVLATITGAGALGLPLLEDGNHGRGGIVAGQDQGRVAERAPVENTFTCEHTVVVPPQDLPEIYGEGPDLGVGGFGVARYEILPSADGRRELQAGDEDGKLIARVGLRPSASEAGGWLIDGYERCTGPDGSDVPVDGRFELGTHGRAFPEPPPSLGDGPMAQEPLSKVLPLDDRAFYNRLGVVEHRTLYAYETAQGVTIAHVESGRVASTVSWGPGERPEDVLGLGFVPDDPSPSEPPSSAFAGWAYYTQDTATLTGRLEDGREIEARRVLGYDWRGVLHVLLAPADELESVTLKQGGRERVFEARR